MGLIVSRTFFSFIACSVSDAQIMIIWHKRKTMIFRGRTDRKLTLGRSDPYIFQLNQLEVF